MDSNKKPSTVTMKATTNRSSHKEHKLSNNIKIRAKSMKSIASVTVIMRVTLMTCKRMSNLILKDCANYRQD